MADVTPYRSRWLGPWRITEVWTTGLPEDDPVTLDEHGGYTEHRWVREYEAEAHCERCSPRFSMAVGPTCNGSTGGGPVGR